MIIKTRIGLERHVRYSPEVGFFHSASTLRLLRLIDGMLLSPQGVCLSTIPQSTGHDC